VEIGEGMRWQKKIQKKFKKNSKKIQKKFKKKCCEVGKSDVYDASGGT
jgi:mRNA-degrading endonuclease RelE of RelBE toxin-antitoxin system